MSKTIIGRVRLYAPAGKAAPNATISASVGAKGIPPKQFCDAFNKATEHRTPGVVLPTTVLIYGDKSFHLIIHNPSVTALVKEALNVNKLSKTPGRDETTNLILTEEQLMKIVKLKLEDANGAQEDQMRKTIMGSLKSMGVIVSS